MERLKYIVALLVLLAYTGQSLAAAGAPCFMMAPPSGQVSEDTASMDHAVHLMASAEQPGDSCCDSDGFCSMSHCQSAAALLEAGIPGNLNHTALDREVPSILSVRYSLDLLYRPPISS